MARQSGTPGTSFGAHIWRGGEAALNQHIFRVDFDDAALDKRFFRFAINAKLDDLIGVAHGGVGLRHVTKGVFERTPILLPPRAEQSRIADQLDTLLARIQACNDRLGAVPVLLSKFRRAVVGAAVNGGLSDSPLSPEDQQAWDSSMLEALIETDRVITYGVIKLGEVVHGGTPCLRTSNVRWLRYENDDIKTISPALSAQYARTVLKGGEVLVNVRGTLGGVAVASTHMQGWNVSREIAVVPVDASKANPQFIALCIASEKSQAWLRGMQKGVAYVGINIEDLRRLPIRLPPLSQQQQIVERAAALFAIAESIHARLLKATTAAQTLGAAALAKAFRGELVEQDPRDEPASQLLARLTESRDAQPRPARGRKRGAGAQLSSSEPYDTPDWLALPDGAWACPPDPEGLRASVLLTAVLRAWGDSEAPQAQARLAYLLCEQPRLLSAVLPEALAQQWQRLVGDEARPVSAEVSVLQPAVNIAWRRAVVGMRARGDLLEAGFDTNSTWALGASAAAIETSGWPQGRAVFVIGYLRAHGIESVLPTLEPAQREFVDARAA